MLESLFGSPYKEKVLIFILSREGGYARQIADFFDIPLTPVINQLKKLELGNVLYAEMQGKTKVYKFNPRFPFIKELKQLLQKALDFYPENLKELLLFNRRRPRRSDKKL